MRLSAYCKKELPQSVFLYGAGFTGKTTAAGLLVREGYTIHLFDLDKGIRTLQRALTAEEQEHIVYYPIPDTNTNAVGIETIGKVFAAKAAINICHLHGKVGCIAAPCKQPDGYNVFDPTLLTVKDVVVVDSTTQLSDSALCHATRELQANILTSGKKVDWDAYDYQGMLLKNVLSNMQQARFHRIFIGHEDMIEQADGKELIFPVCGTRAFSKRVPRYFDHVAYAHLINGKFKIASGSGYRAGIMTGSRSSIKLEEGGTLASLLQSPVEEAATPPIAVANKLAAGLRKT